MGRPIFYVERFNGTRWTALFAAPYRVGPADLHGPEGQFPASESAGNISAFTGQPGYKARVRVDDTVVEEFNWEPIPVNPLDPESDRKWGWKSTMQNYQAVTGLMEASGAMSALE